MSDTSTVWSVELIGGDWQVGNLQLVTGGDLETAVLISLFTDRQAGADDQIPDGTGNRRGWWGDATMGSRLWLLARSKLTQQVANTAIDYAKEALKWLVDDGIASDVTVTAEIRQPNMLALRAVITKVDGSAVSTNFDWVWSGVG